MLKPNANYKMSKPLKTSLALSKFSSAQQRHDWKRAMIGAELAAAIQPKREKNRREGQGE
jgi:hypothetical protein